MSSKRSIKSKQSRKSQKVKSRVSKSRKSQKSRQSRKQSKRLKEEIALSKEMSKRISKRPPIIASSHGVTLLKRSKRNLSKGRPLKSARDFLLATSLLTAALSPYEPHHMAQRSKITPDTQVHLDWHKGMFPEGELTSKQHKKLMKKSKKSKRLSTIQEGGAPKKEEGGAPKKGDLITVHWPLDNGTTHPFTMVYHSENWATDSKKYGGDGKVYKIDGMTVELIKTQEEKKQTPDPRVGDEYQAEIPQRSATELESRLVDPQLLGEEYTTPKQLGTETPSQKLEESFAKLDHPRHLTDKRVAAAMIANNNPKRVKRAGKWSLKYKRKINCKRPKGFSQKQYCKRILKKKKKKRTKKNRKKRTKRTRRK